MAPGVLRGKDWDQNRGNFDGYGRKQRFYLLMLESERCNWTFHWEKILRICDNKTIGCPNNVLGTQSDVFETTFLNMDMNEAKFGEYEIKDFNVAEHYGNIDIFPWQWRYSGQKVG